MKNTKKTVDKRQKDIQKKLSAAVLMLLVSSIMMVSSTYAWFTLSTAPEVKGIQTTIAGNGNLEIALANTETWATPSSIQTSDGSNVGEKDINTYWGNLVDLSTGYGLDKITLYPAELSAEGSEAGGYVVDPNLLRVPTYGVDGRVNELIDDVLSGVYTGTYFGDGGYGVRAIGTATGMSDRQFAFRDAKNTLSNKLSAAKTGVTGSISNNGGVLGTIAITHATTNATDGSETYTLEQIKGIGALVSDLSIVVGNIEASIIASIDAYAASSHGLDADADYLLVQGTIQNLDIDTLEVTNSTVTIEGKTITLDSNIENMIRDYKLASARVKSAQSLYNDLKVSEKQDSDNYTWNDISGIFNTLMDASKVTVKVSATESIGMSAVKDRLSDVMNYYTDKGRIDVVLGSGSGVYYDIALLIGEFNANVTVNNITYGSISLSKANANISTATVATPWLPILQSKISEESYVPESDSSETVKLTDLYGYAIDLVLRTNVDSDLLISEAAQRIYSESTNLETMGGGSSMSFTSNVLTNEQMTDLMKAIRIVYMDEQRNILINACLDTANTYTTEGGLTANIKKLDGTNFAKDQVITEMKKNVAEQITVLVYLDGNEVDNGDVANAAESMTGKLNLQFASSAVLVPMDYNELKQVQDKDQVEGVPTLSYDTTSGITAAGLMDGYTYKVFAKSTAGNEPEIELTNVNLGIGSNSISVDTLNTQITTAGTYNIYVKVTKTVDGSLTNVGTSNNVTHTKA